MDSKDVANAFVNLLIDDISIHEHYMFEHGEVISDEVVVYLKWQTSYLFKMMNDKRGKENVSYRDILAR